MKIATDYDCNFHDNNFIRRIQLSAEYFYYHLFD